MESVKRIVFTKHAQEKFSVLSRHGVKILKNQVVKTLFEPLKTEDREDGTYIANSNLTQKHILRVVYKKEKTKLVIITFYPARRRDYGF